MKTSNKIIIILLFIILSIIYLAPITFAYSFEIGIIPSKTSVKREETIALTLSINNFNAEHTDGTGALEAIIEYDPNVFEILNQENITGLDGWQVSYNKGTVEHLLFERENHINKNSNLCNITFKVKPDARTGDTIIKIKNAELSINQTGEIVTATDNSVTINITNAPNYKIKNSNITGVLPKTTVEEFKNNINLEGNDISIYNNKGEILSSEKLVTTGSKAVVSKSGTVIAEYKIIVKGDLNGDGKVTLTDIAKSELAYIGNIELEAEYLLAADINGDEKQTLTDISRLEQYLVGLIEI